MSMLLKSVIYHIPTVMQLRDPDQCTPPLKPIISNFFTTTTLSQDMTLKGFHKQKRLPGDKKILNMFVELNGLHDVGELDVIDVILKDKVSMRFIMIIDAHCHFTFTMHINYDIQETGLLHTGPSARLKVAGHKDLSKGELDKDKWKVFVLCDFKDKQCHMLGSNTEVLHQVISYHYSNTYVCDPMFIEPGLCT